MPNRTTRIASLAAALAIVAGSFATAPALASCIPLQQLLPDPATPATVVFVGTVLSVEGADTQLQVDGWYLGASGEATVVVTGGRDPAVITSADWVPTIGEQYAVVASRPADGSLTTDLCQQALLDPALSAALDARYGATLIPGSPEPSLVPGATGSPVVTMSPFPAPLGSPAPG
ncbi:MAG: hypothetical protein LH650_05885 [Chloroflexi bacterium]|nr:hypothetical protein [Chloroflexota bacterium]